MNLIHNIKKNIVAILGMAMIIGLSAWSLTSEGTENSKAVTPIENAEPALYWYPVSSSNTLGAQLNSTPQTKSESMPGGTKQITNCQDELETHCIVGFSTPQSPGSPAPSNPAEDHRINQSND